MPGAPSILFVNSDSSIKYFTLEKANEMDLKTILVKDRMEWEKPYVNYFIPADTYHHEEVLDKIADFNRSHPIDGVVTFWEWKVLLAAKVSQRLGLPGLDIQSARKTRDKYLLRKTLARHGLPGPRFKKVENLKDFRDGLKEMGFPAVLKPLSGTGAKNVIKLDAAKQKELKNTFETLHRLSHPFYDPLFCYNPRKFLLEEYMEGDEVSVEGFVHGDTIHLIAITDKAPLQGSFFIESGDRMPSLHSDEVQQQIIAVAKKGVRALGYRNCGIHGEIKLTEDEPRIIEIAARLGGDYLCDFVEMIYEIDKEGDRVSVPPQGFDYIGWVVASGESPMEVNKIMNDAFEKIRIEIH